MITVLIVIKSYTQINAVLERQGIMKLLKQVNQELKHFIWRSTSTGEMMHSVRSWDLHSKIGIGI